ncbi:glycosyltransferase [Nocardioides sp. BP30]|uniref:glycosyltransferase n=1 Tax=Nocardioides sp. BP30 TaxID=3036374 RepID=UPI0024692E81|nr:glycosyltransferase [Nocardioides sp. BP30]WGL53009.1 glycosyltransferase [Nocardioides sp. BP30]
MRVALVSEHANPLAALGGADAGGQNVHVAALAAGLARLGHEVVVYTRRDSPEQPALVETEDGYVVEHVSAGPAHELPKDELLPHMREFGVRLRDRWRREPVDVVHSHFWMSGLAALQATRGTGMPVVHTFHALGSVKRRQQGDADTSPPQRIDLERRLCDEVDHVIATCSDEVAELERLGLPRTRATVIPCGVDTHLFRPGPERPPPRIGPRQRPHRLLVVGRIVTRKGIGNVIEAVAQLPDVELIIAGGPPPHRYEADPEVQRLRELVDDLRLGDRVVLTGSVERAEVPALIRVSDAVVTVPWYEPFGIVPLEAMACGRPVVGTAVGGLLDTVVPGVTGELVPPREPAVLASTLRELLDDADRCRRYGEAGRRRAVEHYDWSTVVADTAAVYRSLSADALATGAAR